MEKKSTALVLAGITGTMLIVAGAYYMISDLLGDKQGLMFESIVAWSIGLVLTATVVIAERIRRAHDKFADVFDRQAEIQQYLTQKFNEERVEKQRLANMMKGNMTFPGPGANPKNINITDPTEIMKAWNEAFQHYQSTWDGNLWTMMSQNNQVNEERLQELEDELSKAVAEENFERAKEIKKEIAAIKNLEKPDDTQDEDNPESPE